MGKVIFWLVVFFAMLLVLRLVNVAKARSRAPRARRARPDKHVPAPMVRCARCGVFLPRAEARALPDGFHCGQPNCAPPGAAKS